MVALVAGYAFAALWPASKDVFVTPEYPRLLGDGSDMRSQLWQDAVVLQTLREHPTRLLYGAIYTETRNDPPGMALWTTMIERVIVPMIYPVSGDGTHSAWLVFSLMMLNGLSMYWCARRFQLPRALALAAALAFAVNPYTRARASVHAALVGIFFLPLIAGAVRELARLTPWTPRRRSIVMAAAAFFLAAMSAHYYLIIALALMPFWALLWTRLAWPSHLLFRLSALLASALPAAVFMAWQYTHPLPSEVRDRIEPYPKIDMESEIDAIIDRYGSHPIDYLTGDIKLGNDDVLEARKRLGAGSLGGGNLHERTNGIRWSVLLLTAIVIVGKVLLRRNRMSTESARTLDEVQSWALFMAAVCFVCSLAPSSISVDGKPWGLGWVLHDIVRNARIPSRLGPVVHFSLLVFSLCALWRVLYHHGRLRWIVWFFPLLFVVEYLPFSGQPTVPLLEKRLDLIRADGRCGSGLFLPVAKYEYSAYEHVRGTPCSLLLPNDDGLDKLERLAGPWIAWTDLTARKRFVDFANCAGLDWLVFGPGVAPDSAQVICEQIEGDLQGDRCQRRELIPRRRKRSVHACLPQ